MPSYISPAGYRKIVEEYDFLVGKERPRITAEVAWAASLGDRSENSEYLYGKQRLREIDRRLRWLKDRLDGIEVVDPTAFSGPVVSFGATVLVEDEEGEQQEWTILGEDEVDLKIKVISYLSPMGKALLGRAEGDAVVVEAPGGRRELTVLRVRHPTQTYPGE
jgi:transcription elongation factor GreB